ncbi:MAG: hypothetical protein ACRDTJ_07370 [Pseudonocardiaceae bacterium]
MADFNQMYEAATRQDAAEEVEMAYLARYETQSPDPGHPDVGDRDVSSSVERTSRKADATNVATDETSTESSQQAHSPTAVDLTTTQAGRFGSVTSGSNNTAEASGADGASVDADVAERTGETGGAVPGDVSAEGARDETTPPSPEAEEATPGSLTHTDQQEAIQTTAVGATQTAAGAGGASADSAEAVGAPVGRSARLAPAGLLNRSGFALRGVETPVVRRLPDKLDSQLRSELRRALAQDPTVTEAQAKRFCDGLSQGALVVAFLAAHLDLDLPTDTSTTLTTALFRSRSPLLAGVLERLTRLEQTTAETASNLTKVHQDVREMDQRSEIIEQGVAWTVAERAENLVRGANTVRDVDFNHPSAVAMRDKARADMKDLRRREARPIR